MLIHYASRIALFDDLSCQNKNNIRNQVNSLKLYVDEQCVKWQTFQHSIILCLITGINK